MAQYIADFAQGAGTRVTRIAHGVPLGGELEAWTAGPWRWRSLDVGRDLAPHD